MRIAANRVGEYEEIEPGGAEKADPIARAAKQRNAFSSLPRTTFSMPAAESLYSSERALTPIGDWHHRSFHRQRRPSQRRIHMTLILIIVVAVLLLGGGGGYYLVRRR
jgi:hypothetical protein